jgi:ferrochelatase
MSVGVARIAARRARVAGPGGSWQDRGVSAIDPYDAVLLMSFGGPDRPADVMPFLENVTRGRGIPRERLEEVAEHYHHFGGRSPINDQNRALLAALTAELRGRGEDRPVLWGNRNWNPYLTDVLRDAHTAGIRRVVMVTTSAYSSYSGCRQYREDVAAALLTLQAEGRFAGGQELEVDRIRHYCNHPGFVAAMTDSVATALRGLPEDVRDDARLVFVTHSIPTAMDDVSGPDGNAYVTQHRNAAEAVLAGLPPGRSPSGRSREWDLVYCSRSGPPAQPWLEPDVNDHLRALAADGVPAAVLVPIGFVSDHMEVAFDLDTEALETAAEIGLAVVRAATVGTDPRFVAGLADLVTERAAVRRGEEPSRPVAGALGPSHERCPVGCCRNLRADKPAACGVDWAGPAAVRAHA